LLFQPSVRNRDMGKHILGVDDLLQKHTLVEAQINAQGEWLKNVTRQSHIYIRNKGEQYEILQRKLDERSAELVKVRTKHLTNGSRKMASRLPLSAIAGAEDVAALPSVVQLCAAYWDIRHLFASP
jgi:hypothetical protein